jgi:hypothetical protein
MTSTPRSDLVASLHNAAQRATSAAQAIEDPSTRKAIEALADAVGDVARYIKNAD